LSRRVGWTEDVSRMGEKGVSTGFLWENLNKRNYWKDVDVDGRIILKFIFEK
jgi:hypothetical protein